MLSRSAILTNLALFTYFSLKNYLIYKKIKPFKDDRLEGVSAFVVATASIIFNWQVTKNYQRHLALPFLKGSVQLPSFTVLFILADLAGSLMVLLRLWLHPGLKGKYKIFVYEIGRLLTTYAVFSSLVINLWAQSSPYVLSNFMCFKQSLAEDVAEYYFANGTFPEQIEQASGITKNPLTDSALMIKNSDDPVLFAVEDQLGNDILVGYRDLRGIETYQENPEDFLKRYRLEKETYCKKIE